MKARTQAVFFIDRSQTRQHEHKDSQGSEAVIQQFNADAHVSGKHNKDAT